MLSPCTVSRRPVRTIACAFALLLASTPAVLTAGTKPVAPAASPAALLHNYVYFSPLEAFFGNVGVGTTSAPISVTVTNGTSSTAAFVAFSNLTNFTLNGGTCGVISPTTTLAPGASCTFSITFTPATTGLIVGSFTIQAGKFTSVYQMKGNGVPAILYFSPGVANFGSVPVGTISAPITITARNLSATAATLLSATPNLTNFNFQGGTCGVPNHSGSIAAGARCTFTVEFTPSAVGLVKGSFTLSTGSGPATFYLNGTGR
ncbi:MAG TPA: choice-of-anchor D domain-containing protein [Acidisarcina sp.]